MSEWYYVRDGEQAGPVSESELRNLADIGAVTGETLVWRPGLDEWLPYGEALGHGAADGGFFPESAAPAVPILDDEPGDGFSGSADHLEDDPYADEDMFAVGDGQPRCSECGGAFPHEDLLVYGDHLVCPMCKPVFFQRLRESGDVANLRVAGFGQRFLAKIIDGLILAVPMVIVVFVLGMNAADDPDEFFFVFQIVFNFGYYVMWGAYSVYFHGRFGATPGKMVLGIRVVRSDGSDITYLRALGRFGGEILSGFVCYIGYIIAAFDDQRRALHDHLCDTRVVGKT